MPFAVDSHLAKDKDSLERIHRRAAHWITSTYDQKTSVTALLQQINLEHLEEYRRVNRLIKQSIKQSSRIFFRVA